MSNVTKSALRVREVARFLDVGEHTVRRLIESGHLRAFRAGRVLRVSEESLWSFIRTGGGATGPDGSEDTREASGGSEEPPDQPELFQPTSKGRW